MLVTLLSSSCFPKVGTVVPLPAIRAATVLSDVTLHRLRLVRPRAPVLPIMPLLLTR